jgi:DnaJ-class molecular chaperone
MVNMICYNCKGNGYVKLSFEAETSIEQCEICHSQGELDETKYYHQTWTEGVEGSIAIYYGPLLDSECFENYKIHKE